MKVHQESLCGSMPLKKCENRIARPISFHQNEFLQSDHTDRKECYKPFHWSVSGAGKQHSVSGKSSRLNLTPEPNNSFLNTPILSPPPEFRDSQKNSLNHGDFYDGKTDINTKNISNCDRLVEEDNGTHGYHVREYIENMPSVCDEQFHFRNTLKCPSVHRDTLNYNFESMTSSSSSSTSSVSSWTPEKRCINCRRDLPFKNSQRSACDIKNLCTYTTPRSQSCQFSESVRRKSASLKAPCDKSLPHNQKCDRCFPEVTDDDRHLLNRNSDVEKNTGQSIYSPKKGNHDISREAAAEIQIVTDFLNVSRSRAAARNLLYHRFLNQPEDDETHSEFVSGHYRPEYGVHFLGTSRRDKRNYLSDSTVNCNDCRKNGKPPLNSFSKEFINNTQCNTIGDPAMTLPSTRNECTAKENRESRTHAAVKCNNCLIKNHGLSGDKRRTAQFDRDSWDSHRKEIPRDSKKLLPIITYPVFEKTLSMSVEHDRCEFECCLPYAEHVPDFEPDSTNTIFAKKTTKQRRLSSKRAHRKHNGRHFIVKNLSAPPSLSEIAFNCKIVECPSSENTQNPTTERRSSCNKLPTSEVNTSSVPKTLAEFVDERVGIWNDDRVESDVFQRSFSLPRSFQLTKHTFDYKSGKSFTECSWSPQKKSVVDGRISNSLSNSLIDGCDQYRHMKIKGLNSHFLDNESDSLVKSESIRKWEQLWDVTLPRSTSCPVLLSKRTGVLDSAVQRIKSINLGEVNTLGNESSTSAVEFFDIGRKGEVYEDVLNSGGLLAEALWDHTATEPDELSFEAGTVIVVLDTGDRNWWWGKTQHSSGYFPSAFVRFRVGQEDFMDNSTPSTRIQTRNSCIISPGQGVILPSSDKIRSRVVKELLNTERDFVKILNDIQEGYVTECRKRTDMFNSTVISAIFSNLEHILAFQKNFYRNLEARYDVAYPHKSCVGQTFLTHKSGFQLYSEYCNSYPMAIATLQDLYKNDKYNKFFETCRLVRGLAQIPLDGYLLTPVQRICKYPLQLAELVKYTKPEHADHASLLAALEAMKKVAYLINERRRKMENLEKLATWQCGVEGWEGEDLIENSSELLHQGDVVKVNSGVWIHNVTLYLFDHQIIYCKKDLLRRNMHIYKGRIALDGANIINLPDGKNHEMGVTIKHGITVYNHLEEKWLVFCCRCEEDKNKWFDALINERKLALHNKEDDLELSSATKDLVKKAAKANKSERKLFKAEQLWPNGFGIKTSRKVGNWFTFGGGKRKEFSPQRKT